MLNRKVHKPKYELEVESHREGGNYIKAIEVARRVASKSGAFQWMEKLLIIQKKYEDLNIAFESLSQLGEANETNMRNISEQVKSLLGSTISTNDVPNEWMQEARILQAKALFAAGSQHHKNVIPLLDKIDTTLCELTMRLESPRSIILLCEVFLLKAKCQQIVYESNTDNEIPDKLHQERRAKIIADFTTACHYCYYYHQSRTMPKANLKPEIKLGLLIETHMTELPGLISKWLPLQKAIESLRSLVNIIETKPLTNMKLLFANELCELLIFRTSSSHSQKLIFSKLPEITKPPVQCYSTNQPFKSLDGEILLLLCLCVDLANQKASVTYTGKENNQETAISVYSLLTEFLQRKNLSRFLKPKIEAALRYSFEQHHIWKQFALTLVTCGQYDRAFRAFEEVQRIKPEVDSALQMARIAFCHLHDCDRGLEMANTALSLCSSTETEPFTRAKVNLWLGMGKCLKAEITKAHPNNAAPYVEAMECFNVACEINPFDHVAYYQIARLLAVRRELSDALQYLRRALMLRPDHSQSIYLFCLLLAGTKRPEEALSVVESALEDQDTNWPLWFLRIKLEKLVVSDSRALGSCRKLMRLASHNTEMASAAIGGGSVYGGSTVVGGSTAGDDYCSSPIMPADCASVPTGFGDNDSIFAPNGTVGRRSRSGAPDTASQKGGESLAGAALEEVMLHQMNQFNHNSDIFSSVASGGNPQQALIFQIWLLLTDLYMHSDELADAHESMKAAANLAPLSHQLQTVKGDFLVKSGDLPAAIEAYQTTIMMNPTHTKALLGLSRAYVLSHDYSMARKHLRDLISLDTYNHEAWQLLGRVNLATQQYSEASENLSRAAKLQLTASILPYTTSPILVFE